MQKFSLSIFSLWVHISVIWHKEIGLCCYTLLLYLYRTAQKVKLQCRLLAKHYYYTSTVLTTYRCMSRIRLLAPFTSSAWEKRKYLKMKSSLLPPALPPLTWQHGIGSWVCPQKERGLEKSPMHTQLLFMPFFVQFLYNDLTHLLTAARALL